MIAHVAGVLTEKFADRVIVDVHGVGYELTLSATDAEAIAVGEEVKFYTYHSVRETAEELYGFSALATKKLFELLLGVQGVGPKAGMAVLSLAPAEEVRSAIANANSTFIAKASGVGRKTAERIIVDLRDKVGAPTGIGEVEPFAPVIGGPDEALDALIALGFPLREATQALASVDRNLPTAERIRLALKQG